MKATIVSTLLWTSMMMVSTHGWMMIPTRARHTATPMFMAAEDGDDAKAVKQVSGEDLEMMLMEWEQPLGIDALATWYVCCH